MSLLKPFLPYLLGGCAFMTLASGLIAWWAWDERDEAQEAQKRAEAVAEAYKALGTIRDDLRAWDRKTAGEIAAIRAEVQNIELPPGEPFYVTAPTPGCRPVAISGERLREHGKAIVDAILRAGSAGASGEAGSAAGGAGGDNR